MDSLQSMVEGTEERLHRKAVLEQSPGDTCVLTRTAVGEAFQAEGAA